MNQSLRTQLTLTIGILLMLAVGGIAGYLLDLYQQDKYSQVKQSLQQQNIHLAQNLDHLFQLGKLIETDRVTDSNEIVFLFDSPCTHSTDPKWAVSKHYRQVFLDLEINPRLWYESLDVFSACEKMTNSTTESDQISLLPNSVHLTFPYLIALFKTKEVTRLMMISVDGFRTAPATTSFLLNSDGSVAWAADGSEYLDNSILDTRLPSFLLPSISQQSKNNKKGNLIEPNALAFIAYQPLLSTDLTLVTLSYRPKIMKRIEYAINQSLALVLGLFFLALFVGKIASEVVTLPLQKLRKYAERLGLGDFTFRIPVPANYSPAQNKNEITAVNRAFNIMTDRILNLMNETRSKATLESDLKLAQQVQKMLLPPNEVTTSTHFLSGIVKNAAQCGGDWWGYTEVNRPGRQPLLVLMIGDVTGHGTGPALITAALNGTLSMIGSLAAANSKVAEDPFALLQCFNRSVYESAKGLFSMTFFIAVLDSETKQLRCINAGHCCPYLITPQTDRVDMKAIGGAGEQIGVQSELRPRDSESHDWSPGSKMFLYTDGLIDCVREDKNIYERRHLRKSIAKYKNLQGKEFMQRVLNDRQNQVGDAPQLDDLTAIVCQFTPEGKS